MTASLHALARDIEAYRSQGWRVSLIGFHHGCNGYALAVLAAARYAAWIGEGAR